MKNIKMLFYGLFPLFQVGAVVIALMWSAWFVFTGSVKNHGQSVFATLFAVLSFLAILSLLTNFGHFTKNGQMSQTIWTCVGFVVLVVLGIHFAL